MSSSTEHHQRSGPTLWRTCRVLANRIRLRMLDHLIRCPDQTVTAVADRLGVPLAVTSQYLRALNARGLLRARRKGRYVQYRARPDEDIPEARALLGALRQTFMDEPEPVEAIFRVATAFTHPRREEIFRALQGPGLTVEELRAKTHISAAAIGRHVEKLLSRGFVVLDGSVYRSVTPSGRFAQTLARLVRTRMAS